MTTTETPAAPARYHAAAIALHWLIAALLAYQFALGLRMELPAADRFTAFQLHKSVGIAILLLSCARLALRLALPRPPAIGSTAARRGASAAHGAFYAIMLLGPLSGWAIASTAKIKVPTVLFGAVPWPHLPLPAGMHDPAELAHAVLGWALPALFALHLAAALWHWRQADPVPARMLPARIGAGAGLAGGIGLIALAAAAGAAAPLPALWQAPVPAASAPVAAPAPVPTPSASASPTETASLAAEPEWSCDWTVVPGGRLGFTASWAGEPVNGTFRRWSARIRFCEDDPAGASIAATIALGSADTADPTRDENLKGPSFFDAAAFPEARFAARGFKPLGKGRYAADGTLTLRGKSRPVRLVFTLAIDGDTAQAQGTARLSRLAFGVGTDEWEATDQIADGVSVALRLKARRKAMPPVPAP